jgi:hypothetical protein
MTEVPNPLTTYIEDPPAGAPPARSRIALESVDQARAWMCYAAFGGDTEKASIASKVPLSALLTLEHDFNWPAKLKRLKTGAGESEAERVANRAVNYLQAQRMRDVLERALRLIESPDELLQALIKAKIAPDDGSIERIDVNPKAVLDLSKALETVQNMSYRALGDRVPVAADASHPKDNSVNGGNVTSVRTVITMLNEMQTRSREEPTTNDDVSIRTQV